MEGVKGAQGPITGNKGEVDSLWKVDAGVGNVFAMDKHTNKQTNRHKKNNATNNYTLQETKAKWTHCGGACRSRGFFAVLRNKYTLQETQLIGGCFCNGKTYKRIDKKKTLKETQVKKIHYCGGSMQERRMFSI